MRIFLVWLRLPVDDNILTSDKTQLDVLFLTSDMTRLDAFTIWAYVGFLLEPLAMTHKALDSLPGSPTVTLDLVVLWWNHCLWPIFHACIFFVSLVFSEAKQGIFVKKFHCFYIFSRYVLRFIALSYDYQFISIPLSNTR